VCILVIENWKPSGRWYHLIPVNPAESPIAFPDSVQLPSIRIKQTKKGPPCQRQGGPFKLKQSTQIDQDIAFT
jgi:hypothetical protein